MQIDETALRLLELWEDFDQMVSLNCTRFVNEGVRIELFKLYVSIKLDKEAS